MQSFKLFVESSGEHGLLVSVLSATSKEDAMTPALVLADWYEEHNDPLGVFLRLTLTGKYYGKGKKAYTFSGVERKHTQLGKQLLDMSKRDWASDKYWFGGVGSKRFWLGNYDMYVAENHDYPIIMIRRKQVGRTRYHITPQKVEVDYFTTAGRYEIPEIIGEHEVPMGSLSAELLRLVLIRILQEMIPPAQ